MGGDEPRATRRPAATTRTRGRIEALRGLTRHPLARTTLNLYVVQAAVLVLPLVTLPYLTRTLAPANLGLLLFAQAYAGVATLVVQFGFDLSASRDVARRRFEDLGPLVSGVVSAQIALSVLAAAVSAVALVTLPLFREHPAYLVAAWALSVVQGFTPLWFFLGRERLGIQTALDLGGKLAATAAIFVVVRDADDGIKVLLAYTAGTGLATVAALGVAFRQTSFSRPRVSLARQALRDSLHLALYRASAMAGMSLPPLLIGALTTPTQVAYFGVADRVHRVPAAAVWPMSQALYPRINNLLETAPERAARLMRWSSALILLVATAVGVALAALSSWLIPFVFGSRLEPAAPVFRILAAAIPIGVLAHVLVYQILIPLGHERLATRIAWATLVARIALAIALVVPLGAIGMAWAVLGSAAFNAVLLVVAVARTDNPFRSAALSITGDTTRAV